MMALLSPLVGVVADRLGRKKLLIGAMFFYAFAGTAPLWLDSLQLILLSRVGVGVSEAAIMTCCTTLLTDYYVGREREKYLGMQVLVATIAATVFFLVGGALGSQGWRTPFWLYTVGTVLAVLMVFGLLEPAKAYRIQGKLPVPWRQLAAPTLVTLFGGMVFYALIVELPFVLTELGVYDPGTLGMAAAIASLATAAGAFTFRFIARFGPAKVLPVSFGLAGAGLLVVWSASTMPAVMIGAVITSMGTGMLLPALLTWAVSGLRFEQRGRGTGIWTGAVQLGQFACPILLGIFAASVGGLPTVLGILGIFSALAAIAVAVARPKMHQAAEA